MKLLRRHKTVLLVLGIYWPLIFWLTHIPVPAIARQSGMSDKTMHVLAYFALTFLVWFAVSPYHKARPSKLKPWLVLIGILCYGIIDEYLQGRVGRSMDYVDDDRWLKLTFVVDEGPRFTVGNVSFAGNQN